MKKNKLTKTMIFIVLCTIITKVLGVARDLALSYSYGSSSVSDAYLLATTIPVTLFAFIFEGIGASFIPVCAKLKSKSKENRLTSNVINISLILAILTIILVEIFPEQTIRLFASGLDDTSITQAIFFLRIGILGIFFSSIVYIAVYYLNFNNSFIIPVLRAIPMDIAVIISIILSSVTNSLWPLALGIPISLLIELIFLLPSLIKKGYKYQPIINLKDEGVKNIIKWSIPVIISIAIADLNTIVDRQFSSWAAAGGISALTYSSRTINVIRTAIFIPMVSILFPYFSKKIEAGKTKDIAKPSSNILSVLTIISIPLTAIMIYFAAPIIKTLFERGAFGAEDTLITGGCLQYYAIALIGYAFLAVLSKIYYSLTDMKTPMYVSAIGIVINILLNIALFNIMGLSGLALGTSISTIIMAIIQFINLNKKIHFDIKTIAIGLIKSITATIFMLLVMLQVDNLYIFDSEFFSLVAKILIGVIVYAIGLFLLRTKELNMIFKKGKE